jgi:hypothetical protein
LGNIVNNIHKNVKVLGDIHVLNPLD